MNNNSSNINVNINFKANTEAAKNNINALQTLLNQITQTKNIGLDSSALGQAKASAQELQMHLQNAVNVNTGKLDLGRFNASLKAAGSDLNTLSANLRNIGPVGQQAFMKLARAIASAQTPMLNVSNAIAQFGKTLINTVKWQLASNLIHGVQGALQAAVSHAKDLNSALNDIRIVTGYSIDHMSEFVNEARAAAKELNTTTTEYAKASLIFFQQGLTGDAVKERTDVVIKMSQVTHESAEQISSELTAIWNNFSDGTHTLEWYADAITALGAATASSSKEIAQGLQKFAAVADTVGLSYEYATAALATVVAETRQSADIVGTSFKTIFSRLEGLKLGETLDDGTDLNKYSAALLAVGVNIKKANGDLKDMDEILDELGENWKLLSKDQQVALAQTVGGVRQYQQFIALADNWSKVQKNIEIARESDGTLEKQQKIWSESFEAATKRVEEAKKQLYEDLVNDNALIKLNDIFSNLLYGIGNVIKSAGGIVPIIMMIIALLSNTLMPLVKNGINRLKDNIAVLSGAAQRSLRETQNLMRSELDSALNSSGLSKFTKEQIILTQDLIVAKQRLDAVSKNLSTAERAEAEMRYAIYEARNLELQKQLESLQQSEEEVKMLTQRAKAIEEITRRMEIQQTVSDTLNKSNKLFKSASVTDDEIAAASNTTEGHLKGKQTFQENQRQKIVEERNQYKDAQGIQNKDATQLTQEQRQQLQIYNQKLKALDEEIDKTKRLLAIREQLTKESAKDKTGPLAYGMDGPSMKQFSPEQGGDETKSMHSAIRQSVVQSVGGTDIAEGSTTGAQHPELIDSAEIQANSENLGILAEKWGTLTQVVTSAEQVMTDIKTSITQVSESDTALTKANNDVTKTTAQVKKAEEDLKKARKDKKAWPIKEEEALRAARQKLTDATARQKKAIQDNANATKNFAQTQQQAKLAIHSLGESAGLSKDQLQQLDNSLDNINPDTDVGQILTPLIESCREAGGDVEALIEKMRQLLDPEGQNPEVFDNLINKAKEMGAEFVRTKQEEDKVLNPAEEPIAVSKFDKVSGALTGIAGGAAKVAMAYNGLKSVVNVWSQEDTSIMEKIMTTFMSLSMIMPILTGKLGLLNIAKVAYNSISAIGNAKKREELILSAKKVVAEAAENGSTWALVAAKVALAIAENGWAGIVLGAVMLALIGATVATIALISQTKKHTAEVKANAKAEKDAANDRLKAIDAWKQESDAMDQVIGKYKQLNEEEQKNADNINELLEKVPELVKKYREMGESLNLSAEESAEYYKKIDQLSQAAALRDIAAVIKLQEELEEIGHTGGAKNNKTAAINTGIEMAMKTADKKTYGKATDRDFNTYDSDTGKFKMMFVSDDNYFTKDEANQATAAQLYELLTQKGYTASYDAQAQNTGQVFASGAMTLPGADVVTAIAGAITGHSTEPIFYQERVGLETTLDKDNPYAMYNLYRDMQDIYNDLDDKQSEMGKSVKEFLEDNKDSFKELEEYLDKYDEFRINLSVDALKTQGQNIFDIDSLEEYEEYYSALMKRVEDEAKKMGRDPEEAKAAARQWLEEQEYLNDYTTAFTKLEGVQSKYGAQVKKDLKDLYNELPDDQKTFFLNLGVDELSSRTAAEQAIGWAQDEADKNAIQLKVSNISDALSKLKDSGMTTEDWQAIQADVDWEAIGVSFADFMKLSYNEQKSLLESSMNAMQQEQNDLLNNSIEDSENAVENYENRLAQLKEESSSEQFKANAEEYDRLKLELQEKQRQLEQSTDPDQQRWLGMDIHYGQQRLQILSEIVNKNREEQKEIQKALDKEKEHLKTLTDENAIQKRIIQDQARSAVMEAETLDQMYSALAHLQTVSDNVLNKNDEWDALANLGSKYANAEQETESFKRIKAALGEAQASKIDFADTEEGAAALSAKNQAETTYGYMQRSRAHGTDEWSEEDVQQARQARDDARQAYIDAKASYERAQEAQESGEIEKLEAAMREQEDILKSAILIGESADKYDLDPEAVEAQARTIRALNKEMGLSAEQAARMAIANQRMNKGINTLSDSLEDWKKTLKTAKKGDVDWAKTIGEVEAAVKDLIGATDDFELPDDFLDAPENMKLLEKAADGDQVAINTLGIQLTRNAMDINTWSNTLIDSWNAFAATEDGAAEQLQSFSEDMQTYFDNANLGMQALQDNIKALTDGSMTLTEALASVDLNEESWIESLNAMAVATGMSVEQMNSMLNQLGVQAHVEVKDVPQRQMVPTYTEYSEPAETVEIQQGENPDGTPKMVTYTAVRHHTVQGPSIEVDGYTQVAQISTTDNSLTPEINESKVSFTGVGGGKTGGGIGRSNTTSGKKDKSKSSSKKEKKEKKSAEKETERYHEITALIEDYTRELDKAGQAKDRAFGPKKLKAMQAEIAAQAQLNAATEEHIREIREWLEIDKARIAAQGATFDEYGNISNYTALMQQHIDAYNAAVAAYNASGQSDSDKNRFEAAEKAYQDFMDQLSQYEETNDLLQEKLDELIEAQQAKYDKEFEMLQYTIEFKIEADDSILSYLDYMKNKIENFNDGVHDAVEMLATLNNEAAALMDKNSTYNRAIDDTLNHYLSNKGMGESEIEAFINRFKLNNMSDSDMSMLEDMTEAEYQYLLELKDNLLEINNSLIENMNAVVETVQNSFSKTAEDLDKATRPIERAASALENYAAIIDIVGRDALGITDAIAAELDNAAVAVAHSATVAAKAKVDTLQSERDEVQRLYDEAMAQGLTEMAYKWKTVLEEMDDEIASATDDFNSKWQEELTKAREAFENTVERIKQSMLDAFAGSIGSWSALKDSLEYAKTSADRFVPQYKEIYELSKLNRDIMKSIDNTSNIKNKQALRDLQKEINELEQHSGEISQYDLDNARRRYELELARLALEEARDAKSTVRLSKDSEGNWSYVYTANQDEVEKAEQNYEDKLYAMQQANNEYINSLSDQILELEEQYAEKLAEIRLDNTMSEEERNAAIERLNAYFAEQMEYLTNEGQKAVDNNARLFEEEWTTYHNWTDAFGNDVQARIDNQHDFMTQFGDTILGTYTGYGNFDELNAAMVQIAEEASVKMEEAYGALQAQVATAMEAAGIDVAHFGEVVHDTVNDQIVPSAQAAEDAVVEMGKAAVDEFQKLTDGVSTWQTKYATEMQKIINKNEQLAISVNNLATAYANLVAQMYAAADAPTPKPVPHYNNSTADGYTDTGTGGSGGDGSSPSSGGPKPGSSTQDTWMTNPVWKSNNSSHWQISECTKGPSKGQTKKVNEGRHSWAIIGVISHGHGSSGAIPRSFDCECEICHKVITVPADKNYAMDDKGHILIPEYDTGGYTGDWNSSQGKLAILHEKELVLNKDDTKNILGTVEMVRKLSQKIDLNAQTARYAFNYHPIISNPKPIDRELQVDQAVSITAEFPNVQNRTEIEEAFTTLINQASQFANRKS